MTVALNELELLLEPKGSQKSWTVYQALKRRILLGELTYSSPITEQSLAAEYSCSQGTIREALMRLQENGLVERRSYQGTYVTFTEEHEFTILLKLRVLMETECFPLAMKHAKQPDYSRLHKLAVAYGNYRDVNDSYACSEIALEFHSIIFALANVPQVAHMMHRTMLLLHRYVLSRHGGHILAENRLQLKNPYLMMYEAFAEGSAEKMQEIFESFMAQAVHRLEPSVYQNVYDGDGTEAERFLKDDLNQ